MKSHAAASQPTVVLSITGPLDAALGRACVRILRGGGLLFVYGTPRDLVTWGPALSRDLTFKYWIALDLAETPAQGFLKPTHQGLLLFWKPQAGAPFPLAVGAARVPHTLCTACGQMLKDYGGKKHLLNPRGAALSDIWRDLPRRPLTAAGVPADVAQRIEALAGPCLFLRQ